MIRPSPLHPGDRIAVVAPASGFDRAEFDAGVDELRALGFEPWRVALRTHDRVDYTPELQRYSFVDLAVGELYVSAYNRKR
jgi:muramoyltetrapeptide carboxypeptidase LdcA involved in peptidoglycan recycling